MDSHAASSEQRHPVDRRIKSGDDVLRVMYPEPDSRGLDPGIHGVQQTPHVASRISHTASSGPRPRVADWEAPSRRHRRIKPGDDVSAATYPEPDTPAALPKRRWRTLWCSLLALLASAGTALAQPGPPVPSWLVGSWRLTNVFLPASEATQNRKGDFQGYKLFVNSDVLRIQPDRIDWSQTHVTSGGADHLEVRPPDQPVPALLHAAAVTDRQGRRIDLRRLAGAVHIRPASCYPDPDAADTRHFTNCVSFVAVPAAPDRILVILLDGHAKLLLPAVMEFRRTTPDAVMVDTDDVPTSLIGTWRLADAFLVPDMTPEQRDATARLLDGAVGQAVLGLQRNGLDYSRTNLAAGRTGRLLVNRFDLALSRFIGAREVRNAAGRRLDLRQPRATTMIYPRSCVSDPNRTDKDGEPDCVGLFAMRSPRPGHALFYFFKQDSKHPLVPAVLEFKRD